MPSGETAATASRTRLRWAGVLFAIVFPTVVTWAYFFQAARASQQVQQAVMGALKGLQFVFPAVWFWLALRERAAWQRLSLRGVPLGMIFGVGVVALGYVVFHGALETTPQFAAAAEKIRDKIAGFGLHSVGKYAALAAFYAVVHSLLEEYYWRWFVFGQLRQLIATWPAIVVSSLGFMAHHVLVLSLYFGWWTWPTLLFSAAVAVGGMFWAWLYDKTGSLVGPWLSHLIIDAGIFLIGYELVRQQWS